MSADAAPQEREPYTLTYTAGRLRVSEEWLRKEASKGAVPSIRLGRRRMFMEHHIEEILRQAECGRRAGLTPGSLRAKRRSA